MYKLRNIFDNGLYWSTESEEWTRYDLADVFTIEDVKLICLPINGEWEWVG